MNFWPKGAATEPGGAAPESGIVLVDIIFWYNYRWKAEGSYRLACLVSLTEEKKTLST